MEVDFGNCVILLLLLNDVIEELYLWYLLVVRVLCTFLHGCLLVLIEEKVVCYLSSCFVGLSLF